MITSYKQLTGKYLRRNKKRTVLTIIGIMLSVALISTIGLFFKGMQDAQVQAVKNNYGSFHLMFQKTNENMASKIVNNPKVARSGFFTIDEGIKISDKLVVDIITATDKALELFPYKTKSGRLPEKENEVAMEKWVLSYINKDAKVGNEINVNNKKYTLVGILQDNIGSQINGNGVVLSKNNNINKQNAPLLVEISSKTNLKTAVNELKQLGEKDSVIENGALLSMLGAGEASSGFAGLYIALAIIIGIVLIATIAVIYNSFQISVVERIKQFGLLRAVGTTPRQIRKIVLREATILAVIAIPLGLICSIIAINGISIAFKLIGADSVMPMQISISPMVLCISTAVGIISIYLSALVPAYFAGRISPLSAISGRNSITKEKIKRRKNRIVQKIFGFEGAMAAKNIKRNRKRYRITVFSIVISVVLFVTFKSFMDMSLNISDNLNESKNIHFSIMSGSAPLDSKIEDDIKSLKLVDKVYGVYNPYFFDMAINKNSQIKEIEGIGNIYKKTNLDGVEKTLIGSSISIYDKDSLEVSKKYLQAGNINIEKLNSENGVILINKNQLYNEKTKKSYYGPVADVKVGDEIDLQYDAVKQGEDTKVKTEFGKGKITKVKVMAILENEPFNFRGESSGLKIITTEEMGNQLLEGKKFLAGKEPKPANLNIVLKDIKNEDVGKTAIENIIKSNPSLTVINNIDSNRESKSAILMVKILLYGFVLVVSLIGSVNIINTLTTNIILRKKEFATLKAIGLTQKGLKKMIVLEGLMYGIVGAIYGSIIGCGFSYLLGLSMGGFREFGWKVPWVAVAIAMSASIIIGYISVISPLARIKKENLIESVREDY